MTRGLLVVNDRIGLLPNRYIYLKKENYRTDPELIPNIPILPILASFKIHKVLKVMFPACFQGLFKIHKVLKVMFPACFQGLIPLHLDLASCALASCGQISVLQEISPNHYIYSTLQVAVSVCFPPEVPQLARFMCIWRICGTLGHAIIY